MRIVRAVCNHVGGIACNLLYQGVYMTCLERIECIKAATPTVVALLIAVCCALGTAAILLGHLSQFSEYLDKLIGTLLIIAGMQERL